MGADSNQPEPWDEQSPLGRIREIIQGCPSLPLDQFQKLLSAVENVNTRDVHGISLLHYAAAESRVEILRVLLEAGADVNATDDRGFTPLGCAAGHAFHESMRLLLAAGATVDPRSIFRGITPLHEAGDPEAARILIDAGADMHARDADGNTPLHWAMWENRTKVAEELIRLGANPWLVNHQGLTPQDDRPDDWLD